MGFTGQLGTDQSQLGNILLGAIGIEELNITVSSNLNSWQDSTVLTVGKLRLVSDTLVFSDTFRIVLGLNQLPNDNLNSWLDNIDFQLPTSFGISVNDSLNNWDDLVLIFKQNVATPQLVYKLDEVNYIRRYLNDVVTEVTDSFSFPSAAVYKPNEIMYIRRYLNDV